MMQIVGQRLAAGTKIWWASHPQMAVDAFTKKKGHALKCGVINLIATKKNFGSCECGFPLVASGVTALPPLLSGDLPLTCWLEGHFTGKAHSLFGCPRRSGQSTRSDGLPPNSNGLKPTSGRLLVRISFRTSDCLRVEALSSAIPAGARASAECCGVLFRCLCVCVCVVFVCVVLCFLL